MSHDLVVEGAMKIHIGLIAPYSAMIEQAERIAERKNIRLSACTAVLEDVTSHARRMEISGVDAIVVREGSDVFVRQKVNVPVVPMGSGCYNVLHAIAKARSISDRIGLANFMGRFIFVDEMKKVINCSIEEFVFSRYEEANEKIRNLVGKVDVLVGGGLTTTIAESNGMHSVMIEATDEEIELAIDLACSLVETKKDQARRRKQRSIIVNNSTEGIVAVDVDQNITVYNSAAESIFDIPYREAINTRHEKLLQQAGLLNVTPNDTTANEILKIKGKSYFARIIPLVLNNEYFGSVATYEEVARVQEMEQSYRLSLHKKGHVAKFAFDDIIGESKAIKDTIERAKKYAQSDFTVLITGETGTGKELFAQSIFSSSKRNKGPFVTMNCATLPPNLLEAELFGYEEGAFTGARKGGKQGYFELAHRGVIFLDEIGTIPTELQIRLLRVIQEKEIVRVGGSSVIPVDIRVISATNTPLVNAVSEGKFREDLYYRLNVLNLHIPPLRERREDIPLIADTVASYFKLSKHDTDIILRAFQHFTKCQWKGNVRELMNLIAHLAVLIQDIPEITEDMVVSMIREITIPLRETEKNGEDIKEPSPFVSLGDTKKDMEKKMFQELLSRRDLSKSQIADKLGVSRTTFWRKCKEYGLA
jgi:transcriptional regulator with PAS, ATPase and Fis domain